RAAQAGPAWLLRHSFLEFRCTADRAYRSGDKHRPRRAWCCVVGAGAARAIGSHGTGRQDSSRSAIRELHHDTWDFVGVLLFDYSAQWSWGWAVYARCVATAGLGYH